MGGVFGLSGRDGDTFGATVGERGCYEDGCEAADATDERCVADVPIFGANVLAGRITTAVDGDAEDDEDLDESVSWIVSLSKIS